MSSPMKITLSIACIKKRMAKLNMVQQQVDNLDSRIENLEKKFTDIKKFQDYQAQKFGNHGNAIAKILSENKNLKK